MKVKVEMDVNAPNNIIGQMKRGGFTVTTTGDRMVIKVGNYTLDPLKNKITFISDSKDKKNDDHVA